MSISQVAVRGLTGRARRHRKPTAAPPRPDHDPAATPAGTGRVRGAEQDARTRRVPAGIGHLARIGRVRAVGTGARSRRVPAWASAEVVAVGDLVEAGELARGDVA